jgi:hypothetical protein
MVSSTANRNRALCNSRSALTVIEYIDYGLKEIRRRSIVDHGDGGVFGDNLRRSLSNRQMIVDAQGASRAAPLFADGCAR